MKRLTIGVLTLVITLAATQARATAYTATEIIDAGGSYTFENGVIKLGASGISDTFSFTLGSGVSAASFLFNIAWPSSPTTGFTVSYLNNALTVSGGNVANDYSYWDGEETITFSALDKTEYAFSLAGSGVATISVAASFATPFLETQNYSLTISAPALAAADPATVPEPPSHALALLGLGLMAGAARRKPKSN